MAAIRYTAQRTLMSGHSAGGLYSMTVSLATLNRRPKPDVNSSKAINGDTYGLLLRHVVEWICETGPVTGTAADQIREFLDSCEAKERLEFAPYNAAGDPLPAWRNVIVDSSGYTEKRVAMRPGGGAGDYFSFSFTLEEVP